MPNSKKLVMKFVSDNEYISYAISIDLGIHYTALCGLQCQEDFKLSSTDLRCLFLSFSVCTYVCKDNKQSL